MSGGRPDFGRRGEALAAEILVRRGYRLLEQNYSCDLGEIDFITEKDDRLVFVEVKTRRNLDRGHPAEAVNRVKQNKIRRVALYYLDRTRQDQRRIGFDVLAIIDPEDGSEPVVELIPEAF